MSNRTDSNSTESNHAGPIQWVLRNRMESLTPQEGENDVGFIPEKITASGGKFGVHFNAASGGKSRGMELLAIDTGTMKIVILPDRGMGIWKCDINKIEFGWNSPVDGPVHPSLVPIFDPSGIGWLEGFDELLVRCGLHSNGAPEFHENGQLRYPLHGRIANTPADKLEVIVDSDNGTMDIIGTVYETRFLVCSLELQTRYRLRVNSSEIEVTDTVTNTRSGPATMQLLYHINVGQPVVQAGTSVHAAFKQLVPRNGRSAEGIGTWNQCEGPESGFTEQVYLMSAASDTSKWSEALLASEDRRRGISIQFDTRTLPYLNLWKNTGAVEDGYVVGIEPATGFPNPRSFEEKQNRVVTLAGGESRTFRLKLQPMVDEDEIQQSIARIESMQPANATIVEAPTREWSVDAP